MRAVTRLSRLHPGQVPHGAVHHGEGGTLVGARDNLREEYRVLVGVQVEIGVEVGLVGKPGRPQALPVLQVSGDSEPDPRGQGP